MRVFPLGTEFDLFANKGDTLGPFFHQILSNLLSNPPTNPQSKVLVNFLQIPRRMGIAVSTLHIHTEISTAACLHKFSLVQTTPKWKTFSVLRWAMPPQYTSCPSCRDTGSPCSQPLLHFIYNVQWSDVFYTNTACCKRQPSPSFVPALTKTSRCVPGSKIHEISLCHFPPSTDAYFFFNPFQI